MKIIHVSTKYPPSIGGMQNAARELAERSAKKGHQVTVLTSNYPGRQKSVVNNGLIIERLWSLQIKRLPIIIPSLPFKLFRILDSKTVVHLHYCLDPFLDIAFLAAFLKKARIVSHFHIDPEPSGLLGFLNPLYKRLVWKSVLSHCKAVICPTTDYVKTAESYDVPESKCAIIPYGIDISQFKRKNSSVISKPVKLLFVGRLNKQKNIPRLLEAFMSLRVNHEVVLYIVGEGIERDSLEDIIRKNNIQNVIMTGALVGNKLADIYTASDIFVLPSDYESFGIVNLEAMASGLPVVASDIPGTRNLLEGAALLVKPAAEKFTTAIIRLIEDPNLRNELILKGFEKVREYDWDGITDKVINLYSRLDPE